MAKQEKYKPKSISGYPEWLPEQRAMEVRWMDMIRETFESYGYCNIETPSVEELDALLAKGATDKEIYTLTRLQAEDDDSSEARLALHFDLTVPFARYTAQHFNDLIFPFKRYQMQRVWRGERPQKGRFREFYQCDIDVINIDHLPLHFDAEMPLVMHEIYQKLDLPEKVQIRMSNRKILIGYLQGLGIEDAQMTDVTRVLDKLEKIGEDAVAKELVDELGLSADVAEKSLGLAKIKDAGEGLADAVFALGVRNETLEEGVEELSFVLKALSHLPKGDVIDDLSIVRGLDYYTGTILEASFPHDPVFGSIGSGGRYDDLTGSFINTNMPGIGVSIGLSRLFSRMIDKGYLEFDGFAPTEILVVQPSDEQYACALETGQILRKRGFNVEVFHTATKLKKQLAYAEKKKIPYIWFPPFADGKPHEVKDMRAREQCEADPNTWSPENNEKPPIQKKM